VIGEIKNVFHITASHSYETCYTHDSKKLGMQKNAFSEVETKGVKIHFHLVNRPAYAYDLSVD